MISQESLRATRRALRKQLAAIETLLGGEGPAKPGKKRTMSEETKKKLSLAAKARWKAERAKSGK